ncbi:hypothetical protein GOV10_00570, partial [Candidatus Woesearchaeota archaeon]|nr:hypothetical protein [Candidatus Woesearchaeota archaeon]
VDEVYEQTGIDKTEPEKPQPPKDAPKKKRKTSKKATKKTTKKAIGPNEPMRSNF